MIRRTLITSMTVCLALNLLMTLTRAAVQTPQIVVPGRSIGTIRVGMPRTEVWKHLGKPTEIHFFQVAGQSYTWDTWGEGSFSEDMTVISRRGRVIQVAEPVSFSKYQRGLYQNNAFLSLRAKHPHLREKMYYFRDEVGYVLIVDDVQQGIAWSLSLHYIDNFDTHLFTEVSPERVIIHPPGRAALPDVTEVLDKHNSAINDIRAWFAAKPLTQKKHKGK